MLTCMVSTLILWKIYKLWLKECDNHNKNNILCLSKVLLNDNLTFPSSFPVPWGLRSYLIDRFLPQLSCSNPLCLHWLSPNFQQKWLNSDNRTIFALLSNEYGHIIFVLSVCLFVVNIYLHYKFWTVKDRDFMFGMYIQLMMPFYMTPSAMTLWLLMLTFTYKTWFILFYFVTVGDIHFFSSMVSD